MAENYTPMMQQYLAVKKEYEDAILSIAEAISMRCSLMMQRLLQKN